MENQPPSSDKSPETELSGSQPNISAPIAGPKSPRIGKSFGMGNKYFFIYVVLLIVAGAITFFGLKDAKKSNPQIPKTGSLTDQQIATLKGSTTLVGDSQQTLDVQSNSVFEGQVLLRGDLNVAGAIKVGSGLTLPSLKVGGTASFSQAEVNGTLSVVGNTALQGQVNIQKNLTVVGSGSFASLSATQLSVSKLTLSGNLTLTHHLIVSGGAPTKINGTALGSGGTVSISGSDSAGTVTVNTGSGPAVGCFISVTFSQKYSSTPRVIISPSNSSAAALSYYATRSATGFSVCSRSTPAAGITYIFDYIVIG